MLQPSQTDLQFVEAVIILLRRQSDDLMLRHHGLDHGTAGLVSPAGTTNHLSQHIKGSLRAAVTVAVQTHVRIQYAHQRHIRQIQSLGHHLRADQHRHFILPEMGKDLLMGVGGADSVSIHPGHLHLREPLLQFLLELLGAYTQPFQRATALGAPFRHTLGIAAMVAHQPLIGAMISESCIASGTFRCLPALHAHQCPGRAPAVEKENSLLPQLPGILNISKQIHTVGRVIAQLHFPAHIHNLHIRQRPAVISVWQCIKLIRTGFCPVHGLNSRCCRAQQHQSLFLAAPPDGHLFSGITGSIFRFIGMLLLLIQDNDSRIGHWCKHRRAGSHHDPRFTAADPLPLVVALTGRQAAMEYCHKIAEMRCHQPQKLGCQCDLRHQEHGAFSLIQTTADQF